MGLKPTCREVHRLISDKLDRELSITERVRMRLHLMVCDICANFNRQMGLIRQAMRRLTIDDRPADERDPS